MRGLLEEPDQMDQHSNSVPKQYSACLGDKVLRAAGRRVQRRGAGVLLKFEMLACYLLSLAGRPAAAGAGTLDC